jgi:hypothetical protein
MKRAVQRFKDRGRKRAEREIARAGLRQMA